MSINAQPFNPTFKLVGNLQQDQVLVYDPSEGAFVNSTISGAGDGGLSLITDAENTGVGEAVFTGKSGSTLQFKSIIGGNGVSVTDNGDALVLSANIQETMQTGTNIGTGNAIYAQNNLNQQLEFKSIAVGQGLSLSDDGQTLTINLAINAENHLDATSNLSDLTDKGAARTNLSVYSKLEADSKFLKLDGNSLPSVDNTWDIGSPTKRFNDIYAETFQGTAVLANNLTIQGNAGDVLTFNGSTWVAGPAGEGGSTASGLPQTLTLNGRTLSISGGNSVTLPADQDAHLYVRLDGNSIPTQDSAFDIGSPQRQYQDIYAQTLQGVAVLADNLTIQGEPGETLIYSNANNKWVATNTMATRSYVDEQVAAAASGGQIDLSGFITETELADAVAALGLHFSGDYNDLTNKPTIPSLAGYATQQWVIDQGFMTSDSDSQGLVLNGTVLSITNGNSVDLASLSVNVDLTNYYTKTEVDGLLPTAFSGSYNDLTDTPVIPDITGLASETYVNTAIAGINTFSGDYNDLTNKPTLFSGSYNDLTDIPQTEVDLSGYALKTELFSGSYNDLTDTPTIPSITGLASETYVDNAIAALTDNDNQTLTLTGTTLSISGGNSVNLAGLGSGDVTYTDADARAAISAGTGLSYNSTTGVMALNAEIGQLTNVDTTGIQNGQVLKWNGSSFVPANDTVLTSTDQLPEGTTNKWWTDARFDSRFAAKSTTDLAEGTNLYYTDARWDARFATQLVAGTNITITNGAGGVRTISAATTDLSAYATTAYVDGAVFSGAYADLTGKPTLFDGAYTSLTGTPTIPADVSDLTDTQNLLSGGPHYTDADVATYLNGNIDTHLIPDTNVAYDLGSAEKKFRDLYLSSATIYLDDATLSKNAQGELLFNGYDLQDFNNLKNKPDLSNLISTDINNANRPVTYAALNTELDPYITSDELAAALAGVTLFSGDYNDLTNKPTIPADVSDLTDTTGLLGAATVDLTNYYTKTEVDGLIPTVFSGDYNDLTNKPTLFDGAYSSLTGTPTIPADVSDLTDTTGLLGQSGFSGDYNDLTNKPTLFSGSYNDLTDKPTLQNLSAGTGIQINTNTVSLNANLGDLQNVSNAVPTTGQVLKWDGAQWTPGADNAGTSGSTTLFGLTDTNISGIANSQILSYNTSNGQWVNTNLTDHPDYFSSSDFDSSFAAKSVSDLGDVDTTGIQTGQFLQWDGTKFVAASVAGGGTVDLTQESINELSDVDTATSTPVNGDVLTWNSTSSKWQPAAAPAGGAGGSASVEYFKLNYATNGELSSITNTTSGVSATILSTTGGDVEIVFSGYNFPPSNVLLYGYAYQSNQYVIMPLNKDINTRVVAGGGTSGNPIAFGSFGSTSMTLKLREADTGSSRSFGTTTHAWIVFSMI
jgi:hypothetical protein